LVRIAVKHGKKNGSGVIFDRVHRHPLLTSATLSGKILTRNKKGRTTRAWSNLDVGSAERFRAASAGKAGR
jgi:hypothetical protein